MNDLLKNEKEVNDINKTDRKWMTPFLLGFDFSFRTTSFCEPNGIERRKVMRYSICFRMHLRSSETSHPKFPTLFVASIPSEFSRVKKGFLHEEDGYKEALRKTVTCPLSFLVIKFNKDGVSNKKTNGSQGSSSTAPL